MALIICTECKGEVSDKAAVCMRCGAPVGRLGGNAIPVLPVKQPRSMLWYWWLWGPLGLFAALMLLGALIPKSTVDANAFARACREFSKGDPVAQFECDKAEARIRHPAQGQPGPPVNTSFKAAPPTPPSSASNDEILRRALYPELYRGSPQRK